MNYLYKTGVLAGILCLAAGCHGAALRGAQSPPSARPAPPPAAAFLDSLWRGDAAPGARFDRAAVVRGIAPGEKALLADLNGPGVIRHIWITAQSQIPQHYALLTLRVWWDEETEPSVETPLGDFFGVGFGAERPYVSFLADMAPAGAHDHAALNCYWPMPFNRRARIEIENRATRPIGLFFIHVDYERLAAPHVDPLYFHAQWRRENPVTRGRAYTILEARGRGAYAGTVMNYHLLEPGAWVEGGDQIYLDGSETPLPASGTEDYFGHAWGFREERQAPFHGVSYGPDGNRMTAYRWHAPDPIRFNESIRVTLRCHGWDVGDRADDYSSVAFWYQAEPHAAFPPLPPPDYDFLRVEDPFRVSFEELYASERIAGRPAGRALSAEAREWRVSGQLSEEFSGARAFDGSVATKWADLENAGAQWLALDFGEERTLTGFLLKNCSAAGESPGLDPPAFRVETAPSLEGPWSAAALFPEGHTPPDPALGTAVYAVRFSPPVRARCVRLFLEKPAIFDSYARIPEFEVYGE